MLLGRRQVGSDVLQCLDAWFFIIGYCYRFGLVHRDDKVAGLIKTHGYLFIYDKDFVHFGFKIRIFSFKVVGYFIGFYLTAFQNRPYSIRWYLGKPRVSGIHAVFPYMLLEAAVCPQFLTIPDIFWFRAGDICYPGFFIITNTVWPAGSCGIIQCIIYTRGNIFCHKCRNCITVDAYGRSYFFIGHAICT